MPKQPWVFYMGDCDLKLLWSTWEGGSWELDPSVQKVVGDTEFDLANYIEHQFDNVNT